MALAPLFIFLWMLLPPTTAVADGGGRFDWQIVTGRDFSSQIRLYPHCLLFITDPWSGESRSLMKQISHELINKQEELNSLKLMVVYRNHDRVLADSLGSTEGLTVLCYHQGISYKHKGRLRARDILYSMSYLIALAADKLPLEKIENPEHLDKFLSSTDKAVLLIESCEWTSRLLAQHKYNETGQWSSLDGGDGFAGDSSIDSNQTTVFGSLKNLEAAEMEGLKCDARIGFDGIFGISNFIYENDTFTKIEQNEKNHSVGSSCGVEEYQKFSSFFSKFIVMARNLFLPPQRQRFGLISNKSLLSALDSEDFDTWALIIYNSACPNGSMILKEVKDLQVALEMQSLPIRELIDDGMDDVPALPIQEPSVILFVDRLADSSDIRKRSKEALDAFKDVVLRHKTPCQTSAQNTDWLKKSPSSYYKGFSSIPQSSRIGLSSPAERFRLKEKMSVVLIKDGKHVTLENAGSEFSSHSLQEILTYMLGERKSNKLSSVAKEAGFQLLSDDIDIKINNESPPLTGHADTASPESSRDNLADTVVSKDKDLYMTSSSASDSQQQSDAFDDKPSSDLNEEPAVDDTGTTSPESSRDNLGETVINKNKELYLAGSSVSGSQQQLDAFDDKPSRDLNEEPAVVDAGTTSPESSRDNLGETVINKNKELYLAGSSVSGCQQQSDAFDVKPSSDLNEEPAVVDAGTTSPESSRDNLGEMVINKNKELYLTGSSVSGCQQQSDAFDDKPSSDLNEEPAVVDAVKGPLEFQSSDQSLEDNGTSGATDVLEGLIDVSGEKLNESQAFFASFFFTDGNYQLLKSLTGESIIPRMVIVDPISQLHYVFPDRKHFSYSSVEDFIDRFFNKSLLPYQRSGPLQESKEFPHPPFVNLDFSEKFSIPYVTTNTFSQLVLGARKLDVQNASNPWDSDVLVLFSNSWCGFCQRMEVVLREVYRSLKGYMDLIKNRSLNEKVVLMNDQFKAVMLKLPIIYRIDCTLNDCSWILKSFSQKELYPSLLLFPAERKNALLYEGDTVVNDIVKFIADHGRSSFRLVWQKDKRNGSKISKGAHSASQDEIIDAKEDSYKVILRDREGEQVRHYKKCPDMSKYLQPEEARYNVMVGSFIIATEKLAGSNPFSDGRILILRAEHNSGVQGLMVNKRITWESLSELNVPDLVKKAPLSFGGPVVHQESPLVALSKGTLFRDNYPEVLPGVYFLDHSATLQVLELLKRGEVPVNEFWFFLGYSGWNWSQLFDEISQGAWTLDDGTNGGLDWP